MDFSGNFLMIELLNSLSHGVGVILAICCAAILPSQLPSLDFWSLLALATYLASLIVMFLNSTLYHSFFYMIHTHYVFQVLDHAGIYLLIAGSYTPVLVLGCRCATAALILAMVVVYWLTAALGVALVTIAPWPKPRWYERVSLILYVVMGVAGAPVAFSPGCGAVWQVGGWIAAGGLCFLSGVPFFVSSAERPTFHIIWHVFVLCGCSFMLVAVWHLAISSERLAWAATCSAPMWEEAASS